MYKFLFILIRCCGRVEVSVQRRDLNDNILRKLYVGYNQTKQIYIAFLVGNELQRLEILKKSDILSFSRVSIIFVSH